MSESYFIASRFDRFSQLVEGILAVEVLAEATSIRHGRKYSLSYRISDTETWNVGTIEILRLTRLPSRLQNVLQKPEVDEDTLSQWTELRTDSDHRTSIDAANHGRAILNKILAAVPPGSFVIPDKPRHGGSSNSLLLNSTPIQQEALIRESDSEPVHPAEKDRERDLSHSEPSLRGWRRLINDEIKLVRVVTVLEDFKRRRRQDPGRWIKDIEQDLEKDYGIASRTLRDWRKKYQKVIGL